MFNGKSSPSEAADAANFYGAKATIGTYFTWNVDTTDIDTITIEALVASQGNVNAAVERLLG